MIPTREQAWDLLCEYNEGEFHRLHARIVGDVMRYFAVSIAKKERGGGIAMRAVERAAR